MKPTRLLLIVLLFPCLLLATADLREADKAYASQYYYNAMLLYKKASVQKTVSKAEKARISFQIAECFRKMGDWNAACSYYEKCIRQNYPDDRSYLYLGQMQQMKGQYQQAILNFQEYQRRVPSDPAAQAGIDACQRSIEWLAQPTRYQVTNESQLNSKYNDFCPAWSDKKHSGLIFTSKRDGQTGSHVDPVSGNLYSDLFEAKMSKNGKWSSPAAIPGDVNLPYANDGASCITKNGTHIYFTRCDQKKKSFVTCKIYYAEKRGNTWGAPVLVDFGLDAATLDSFNFRHPAVSVNEDVMVFSSDMSGSMGGEHSDLWVSTFDKKTKTWSKPVNMGPSVNTTGREGFPYISDDGTLYFSSDGRPGMGGLDLYMAPRTNANEWKWNAPENMRSPINSPADDFGIVFDGKKQKGYFTSNREGTKGADDIWSFFKCDLFVEGHVRDCESNAPVENSLVEMICSNGESYGVFTDKDGKYRFKLLDDVSYVINVVNDSAKAEKGAHYLAIDQKDRVKFTTVGVSDCQTMQYDFCCKKLRDSIDIAFPAVLYDLGQATLRPESKDSLNYLYQLLIDNPNFVIELDAHTDCRGTSAANRDLAQRRAQSCVDYLISKGIAKERLVAKGWGEDRPLRLPNGTVLTEKYISTKKTEKEREALHQLNRRTVFKILRTDYVDPKAPKTGPVRQVRIKKGYFDEMGEEVPAEEGETGEKEGN